MNLCTHGIYEVYRSPSISNDFHELIGIDRKNLYQKYVAKPTYDLKRLLKEGINYV